MPTALILWLILPAAEAVHDCHLSRFPSRYIAHHGWRSARDFHNWRDDCLNHGWGDRLWCESRRSFRAWDWLDDAHSAPGRTAHESGYSLPLGTRGERLGLLRVLIGEDDWHAGRMPAIVPGGD